MEKYIGTKQVEAEPMTLGDFIETRRRDPYATDPIPHPVDEMGYLVKYEDGYESWSPKAVFEKNYYRVGTFVDRLKVESKEVNTRLEKLKEFINSEKFREVVPEDYPAFLLSLQYELMKRYCDVLKLRISDADGEIPFRPKMPFGVAIEALKAGLAIRRQGWNGKGLFVVKQVPAHIVGSVVFNMQSLPKSAKELILKGKGFIDYTDQCLIYNENTGRADSWVPSVSDVFADDWEIVM